MAYSELIKNFEKIRDYMREFFVYGFKSREDYDRKSARSYDDVHRRIESWLGDYMSFHRTPDGKNVFISVDSRSVQRNPLYNAWKTRSFTDNDITLHFYIMDLLAEHRSLTLLEIVEGIAEYLNEFDSPLELDESTIRKKLKEYEGLGLITSEKQGKKSVYRLAEDHTDLESWKDAVSFFSEEAPLGVIGSFLLDKIDDAPGYFNFKHRFILHTLDSQVMYDILEAMREKCCIDIVNFSSRKEKEQEHRIYPLKIYVSTQNGREYLLAYHYKMKKPIFFRMDGIRKVVKGPAEKNSARYEGYAAKLDENLWGTSVGFECYTDHVELTVRAEQHEKFIVDRLNREKRHGTVEAIDENTYRFTADVYDAGEMLPWIRTFIGRIVSFECDNESVTKRFNDDMEEMLKIYGGENT